MRAWANLYPWDVEGDPAAADRIAGRGASPRGTSARGISAGRAALPEEAARILLAVRTALASRFQREVIAAARGRGARPRGYRLPLLGQRLNDGNPPRGRVRTRRFPVNPARHRCQPVASGLRGWCPASTASRATCSEVRDSAESRLTPRIRSMARSRS